MTAYSAFFIVFAIGVGALAIDVGRKAVLRSQMQDRADAGAMAAAVQPDGRDGAHPSLQAARKPWKRSSMRPHPLATWG